MPPAVHRELVDPATASEIIEWSLMMPDWAAIIAPAGNPDLRRPGAGEREAIRLAKEMALGLLCDDARAKQVARREGVRVTGTLGVIQVAHAGGLVDIEESITRLRERTSMYLSEMELPHIVGMADRMKVRWIAGQNSDS